MLINVLTINGSQRLHAELIPNSSDDPTIVKKWDEESDYAIGVVVSIPGTDIWMTVGSEQDERIGKGT